MASSAKSAEYLLEPLGFQALFHLYLSPPFRGEEMLKRSSFQVGGQGGSGRDQTSTSSRSA